MAQNKLKKMHWSIKYLLFPIITILIGGLILNYFFPNDVNIHFNETTLKKVCYATFNMECSFPKNIEYNCVSEVTFTEGKFGNAVLIDDCDVLVFNLKDEEKPIKSGTINLWAKFNAVDSNNIRYLFDAYDEYNKNRVSLYLEQNRYLTFSLCDSDATCIQIKNQLIEDELLNWLNVAIIWKEEGGILELFVNGNLRNTRDISSINFDSGFKEFFIGSDMNQREQAFAILDEVGISNVPRSESWIKRTYDNANPNMVSFGEKQSIY